MSTTYPRLTDFVQTRIGRVVPYDSSTARTASLRSEERCMKLVLYPTPPQPPSPCTCARNSERIQNHPPPCTCARPYRSNRVCYCTASTKERCRRRALMQRESSRGVGLDGVRSERGLPACSGLRARTRPPGPDWRCETRTIAVEKERSVTGCESALYCGDAGPVSCLIPSA